ncbi:hypothetical protein ACFL34_03385 [Candidatus Sumerlaeota bacterium]
MSINISCPNCQATLSIPEEHADKTGKCPKCAGAITVPVFFEASDDSPSNQSANHTDSSEAASNETSMEMDLFNTPASHSNESTPRTATAENTAIPEESIEYTCIQCGREISIPKLYVGKQGRCKGCGSEFTVPSSSKTEALYEVTHGTQRLKPLTVGQVLRLVESGTIELSDMVADMADFSWKPISEHEGLQALLLEAGLIAASSPPEERMSTLEMKRQSRQPTPAQNLDGTFDSEQLLSKPSQAQQSISSAVSDGEEPVHETSAHAQQKGRRGRLLLMGVGVLVFAALGVCGYIWWEDARSMERYKAWEYAKKENTLEAYGAFLQAYPRSSYAKEASELRHDPLWEEIQRDDSQSEYARYLALYPEGAHAQAVRERISEFERVEQLERDRQKSEQEALDRQQALQQRQALERKQALERLGDMAPFDAEIRRIMKVRYLERVRNRTDIMLNGQLGLFWIRARHIRNECTLSGKDARFYNVEYEGEVDADVTDRRKGKVKMKIVVEVHLARTFDEWYLKSVTPVK